MINRIMLKELSRKQLAGKWVTVGILFFVLFIVQGVIAKIPRVGGILFLIIAGPIALTQVSIVFKVIDNQVVYLDDLISGFNNFVSALALCLLRALFTFLWALLFIIPGIVKSISYSMAFYILEENPDMDISQALAESQRITRGHKWDLFVLRLSFIGWDILACLTFGIGYFWLNSYISITYANAYRALKNN